MFRIQRDLDRFLAQTKRQKAPFVRNSHSKRTKGCQRCASHRDANFLQELSGTDGLISRNGFGTWDVVFHLARTE